LEALGKTGLSADQVAVANDYAGVDVESLLSNSDSLGEEYRSLLETKDDAADHGVVGGATGSGSFSNNAGSPSMPDPSSTSGEFPLPPQTEAKVALGVKKTGPVEGEKISSDNLPNVAEILAAFGQGKNLDPAALELVREELQSLGVTKKKGQTIFRLANRNFRSFSKWRISKIQNLEAKVNRSLSSMSQ
jgi:hypothetical protein